MQIDLPEEIVNRIAKAEVDNGFLCVRWLVIPGRSDTYEINRWWFRHGGSHTQHSYNGQEEVVYDVSSGDEYRLIYPTKRIASGSVSQFSGFCHPISGCLPPALQPGVGQGQEPSRLRG